MLRAIALVVVALMSSRSFGQAQPTIDPVRFQFLAVVCPTAEEMAVCSQVPATELAARLETLFEDPAWRSRVDRIMKIEAPVELRSADRRAIREFLGLRSSPGLEGLRDHSPGLAGAIPATFHRQLETEEEATSLARALLAERRVAASGIPLRVELAAKLASQRLQPEYLEVQGVLDAGVDTYRNMLRAFLSP
ncbi:MAG: hypothetical protein AAFQ71_11630 [Planctomycetota bacterium]